MQQLPARLAWPLNDFCRAVGISRTTAYSEEKAGRLKMFRLGGKVLIAVEDGQDWLDACRSGSTSPPEPARAA